MIPQRRFNRFDDVVATVFASQNEVMPEHGACAYVNDHQQPDAFDFELVRKAEWVEHHDLETDIEPVPVEFNDLVGMCRGGRSEIIAARQAFQVRRASGTRSGAESAQQFAFDASRERSDRVARRIERIIGSREAALATVPQKTHMQSLKAAQAGA